MKNDFSAVATLHFQNYGSCDAHVAKITVFSPESYRAAPPQGGKGAAGGPDMVTLDLGDCPVPTCEGGGLATRSPLLRKLNTHTEPHLMLPARGTHSPGASAL